MYYLWLVLYSFYFAITHWLLSRPFSLASDLWKRIRDKTGSFLINSALLRVLCVLLAARLTIEYGAPLFKHIGGTTAMVVWVILGLYLGSYIHSVVLVKFFELQEFLESLLLGNVWGTIILLVLLRFRT